MSSEQIIQIIEAVNDTSNCYYENDTPTLKLSVTQLASAEDVVKHFGADKLVNLLKGTKEFDKAVRDKGFMPVTTATKLGDAAELGAAIYINTGYAGLQSLSLKTTLTDYELKNFIDGKQNTGLFVKIDSKLLKVHSPAMWKRLNELIESVQKNEAKAKLKEHEYAERKKQREIAKAKKILEKNGVKVAA